jgi:hypothetical protein
VKHQACQPCNGIWNGYREDENSWSEKCSPLTLCIELQIAFADLTLPLYSRLRRK